MKKMDLQKFTGKFVLVDQNNLDEYLKAIGIFLTVHYFKTIK